MRTHAENTVVTARLRRAVAGLAAAGIVMSPLRSVLAEPKDAASASAPVSAGTARADASGTQPVWSCRTPGVAEPKASMLTASKVWIGVGIAAVIAGIAIAVGSHHHSSGGGGGGVPGY
jgi:hypothetical protein